MNAIEIIKNVCEYGELSEEAKAIARDNFREEYEMDLLIQLEQKIEQLEDEEGEDITEEEQEEIWDDINSDGWIDIMLDDEVYSHISFYTDGSISYYTPEEIEGIYYMIKQRAEQLLKNKY